jgi:hypothetical protein
MKCRLMTHAGQHLAGQRLVIGFVAQTKRLTEVHLTV